MAIIINIEPIRTQSKGGLSVTITGLRPAHEDCIVGTYLKGQDGSNTAVWNSAGIARGGVDEINLELESSGEMKELKAVLRQLGAR